MIFLLLLFLVAIAGTGTSLLRGGPWSRVPVHRESGEIKVGKEYRGGEHYPSWIEFMECMYAYVYVYVFNIPFGPTILLYFQHPHLLQHTYCM